MLMQALDIYRSDFRPSDRCDRPTVMVGAMAVAADTDEEARFQFSSLVQTFVALRRGHPIQVPPPVKDVERMLTPFDHMQLEPILSHAIVGGPERMRTGLRELIERTRADEVIVASQMFDHAARVRSYEIVADVGIRRSDGV
jgi:alkanesulfonate monooxygenase SsuD/methylene tetrahydromethanopterin reductase-like flavin-dependent oxidoreductase (luciferase family)